MNDRAKLPLSSIILYAALFTVSWDRFASVSLGGFNIKTSTALFAVALFLDAVDSLALRAQGPRRAPRPRPVFRLAIGGIVFLYLIAALLAENKVAAIAQWAVVVLEAAVPFAAVAWNIRLHGGVLRLLDWFVWGGVLAALFGLYQLAAFYRGWPQIVQYDDTSGGLGRISSFSYEAAYFGYFLILVIGAVLARNLLVGKRQPRVLLGFLLVTLVLVNSRAMLLTLPVLVLLIFMRVPSAAFRRGILVATVGVTWLFVVGALADPQAVAFVHDRVVNLFNPNEQSSNAPRLELYSTVLRIIADHPLVGIGPGQLIDFAPLYGLPDPPGATSNSVIANDIWLQALLDGGPLLLLAELGLVIDAVRRVYRSGLLPARVLISAWLAVMAVASWVTSFYFDTSMWVLLALAGACASETGTPDGLSAVRAAGCRDRSIDKTSPRRWAADARTPIRFAYPTSLVATRAERAGHSQR